MSLALFLILSTCLISATPISLGLEEHLNVFQKNHRKHEFGMHFTLHHVHHLPSTSDLLKHDVARVHFINYRRSQHKSKLNISIEAKTLSVHPKDRKTGASIGLKPGASIGVGNYYVKMGLGTPVTYYDMIIDTGSSLTWMQCEPCTVYCHPQAGPLYNPAASTTHKYVSCDTVQCSNLEGATLNAPMCGMGTNKCVYEASYGDQSYSVGYLSSDTLALSASAPKLPGFVYGCGEDSQGLFGRSAGLIGLARNPLSMISQLSPTYGSIFSYCLPTSPSSTTGTFSIGKSSLYNYNMNFVKNKTSPNMAVSYAFTPMVTDPENPSLYYLRWTGMTVSGKPLKGAVLAQYRNTPTIIDSGTVISRLPVTIYEALRDAFVLAMSSKYSKAPPVSILDTCYYNRIGILQAVPKVSMVFEGGAELQLGPKNLLLEVEKGVSCLAFAGDEATGGLAIVGNTQQQTSRVVYDVANSKIGFSPGGCD